MKTKIEGVAIANDDYHNGEGVSHSALQVFRQDPRKYEARYIKGEITRDRKDYFDFGSAVHELALLGSEARIKLIPDAVLSASGSKAGKTWKEYEAENKDFLLLKDAEFSSVKRCVDSIYDHPLASKLLACDGRPEEMYSHFDETFELELKCKPDKPCFTPAGLLIVDIKTTEDASDAGFSRSVDNYRYYHQAYYYTRILAACGYDVIDFMFIAVEKSPPYVVNVFALDSEYLTMAAQDIESALSDMAERYRSGVWTPYHQEKARRLSPRNYLQFRNQYQ